MTRWQAGFIHLLISICIVSIVACYVIYFWYPIPLLPMANGDKLLMLIGGIDIVVGPLLTLIVYKTGKKSLKIDLTVIAILQACFLSFGAYTIYQSRPIYLVATQQMMDLVFANDILPENLAKAKPEYQNFTQTHPKLVGAVMPKDPKQISQIILSALSGDADLQHMPQYYVSFEQVAPILLKHSFQLKEQQGVPKEKAQILINAAHQYGHQPDALRFVILGSSRHFAVMLIDAKTAQPVGAVNVQL